MRAAWIVIPWAVLWWGGCDRDVPDGDADDDDTGVADDDASDDDVSDDDGDDDDDDPGDDRHAGGKSYLVLGADAVAGGTQDLGDDVEAEVAVFLGQTLAQGGLLALSHADHWSRADSSEPLESHGRVVGRGDVDGDGVPDLIAGAVGPAAGSVELFLGSDLLASPGAFEASAPHAILAGENTGDVAGGTLDFISDLDQDGRDEIVAGAFLNEEVTDEHPQMGEVAQPCAGSGGTGDPAHAPAIGGFEHYWFEPSGTDDVYMNVSLYYSDPDDDVDEQGQLHVFVDASPYLDLPAIDDANQGDRLVVAWLIGDGTGIPFDTTVHFGFTITDGAGHTSECHDELLWTFDP